MQQRRRILIAVSAGVLAALIFGVVLVETRAQGAGYPTALGGNASAPTIPILVAKTDLPQGTKLSAQNVWLSQFPASGITANVITDPKVAYDQYLTVALPQGAAVLKTFLISTTVSAANAVTHPPLPVDPGQEALSIPFDESKGIGGYIQPGDHLDILINDNGVVHYGFQNVPVLRVGAASTNGVGAPALIVIELPPAKAATLAYLYSQGGQGVVRFLLRPQSTTGTVSSSPVGPDNWAQNLDG